jgi:hypothetical protein
MNAAHTTETTMRKVLWRAAQDDYIRDTASFAADREDAEAYRDNRGYGGPVLYRAEVEIDEAEVLDLYDLDESDAIRAIRERTGLPHPGAISPDVWVAWIATDLESAGIRWVRVRDTYPEGAETWTYISHADADDLELIEVED